MCVDIYNVCMGVNVCMSVCACHVCSWVHVGCVCVLCEWVCRGVYIEMYMRVSIYIDVYAGICVCIFYICMGIRVCMYYVSLCVCVRVCLYIIVCVWLRVTAFSGSFMWSELSNRSFEFVFIVDPIHWQFENRSMRWSRSVPVHTVKTIWRFGSKTASFYVSICSYVIFLFIVVSSIYILCWPKGPSP